jgi:hypothetical protein
MLACHDHEVTEPKVTPAPLPLVAARVLLTPNPLNLDKGREQPLVARVETIQAVEIPGAPVKWSSSAPEVATVSLQGWVHAVSGGSALITAQSGEATGTALVTVIDTIALTTPAVVRLTMPVAPFFAGDSLTVSAAVLNLYGRPVAKPLVTWTSSAADVAAISQSGMLRGFTGGTTTVTATSGTASASITVIVLTAPPLRISGSRVFIPGADARLAVIAFDAQTRSSSVLSAQWSTSNAAVATVRQDGTVTGGQEGVATITAVTSVGTIATDVSTRILPGRIALAIDRTSIGLLALDGTAPELIPRFALWGQASVDLSPYASRVAFDCPTGVCWGPVSGDSTVVFQLPYTASSDELSWPSWYGSDEVLAVQLGTDISYAPVATGLDITLAPDIAVDARPRFAPDGAVIFECMSGGLCIQPRLNANSSVFTPVGRRVAISRADSRVSYDTPGGLCVAAVGQAACKLVLPHDAIEQDESSWSPDGRYIAIARKGELWLIQANGDNLIRLPLAVGGRVVSIASPSWSVNP